MDNFSHGTSGVAYFLTQTYLRTNKQQYLQASLKAANLLESISNKKGYIPHHIPGGEDLYYLSWCHGPGGTSRLYYLLYEATKDEKWMEKITLTAQFLMEESKHKVVIPDQWNNVGKCCGISGIGEYYLWLYDITGDDLYLDHAKELTRSVIEKSIKGENHIKWVHAENRVSPDQEAAQTGLMQGSAGIGLWLLQLHASLEGKEALIQLPDKPKINLP